MSENSVHSAVLDNMQHLENLLKSSILKKQVAIQNKHILSL